MPEDVSRVALITGAGRGIGAAIARALAAEGVQVCVADLDLPVAEEVAEETGGLAVRVDVADLESMQSAATAAVERFGDLTILVNNAGLTKPGMLHRMTDEQWDIVQNVCLRGAFNGFRAVAPWFRSDDGHPRRVINMASIAGIHGGAGGANYAAAKAGVIGLTKTMATEWAPFGVTVNAVAPGVIETRLSAPIEAGSKEQVGIPAAAREEVISRVPLGRIGTPEEIAAAVSYFASEEAGYTTGQVLEVHGGLIDMLPKL